MKNDTESRIEELLSQEEEENNRNKIRRRPKKTKKIIIIIAIIAIFLIIIKSLGGKGEIPMPAVSALEKGEIESSLTVTGPVEGTDSVDVTSNLHAKVIELNVKEGDSVKANETVLARLDTSDIEKEIENARGTYELLLAQRDEKMKEQQSQYEKAVSELNLSEADFNRKSALYQTGDISKVDYDSSASALTDAWRTVSGFNTENGRVVPDESTLIELQNAERTLRQVEEKLKDAVIKAPITGTVTRVYTKVGKFADNTDDSNNPMIVVENLEKLQMKVSISEYSIGKVKIGQPVEISADILGEDTVKGEIINISPTGEEKGGGSTERVIPTTISIEDNSRLIAGITAKAEILLDRADDTFVVPISAVSDSGTGDKYMQFVVPESEGDGIVKGSIKSVPVKTGIEGDINIEIRDILSESDRELLREGALYLGSYDASMEGVSGSFTRPEASVQTTAAGAGEE